MARIRSIKPEFPQSETMGKLSRDARLLFIQLWTIVDDDGRARAASRMLASLLYPYDDDAPRLIDGWLGELMAQGCIRRYESDGASYLDIPNWRKHQKIDRPSESRLPPFSEGSSKPREPSRALDADLGPRTLDQDLGSSSLRSEVREPRKTRKKPEAPLPDDWVPSSENLQLVAKLGLSTSEELRERQRFRNHAKQNDRRCVRWDSAYANWLDKAADILGKPPPAEPSAEVAPLFFVRDDTPQWRAWQEHLKATTGKGSPVKDFGWRFQSEWPPGMGGENLPNSTVSNSAGN